jgi:hypothetical protein
VTIHAVRVVSYDKFYKVYTVDCEKTGADLVRRRYTEQPIESVLQDLSLELRELKGKPVSVGLRYRCTFIGGILKDLMSQQLDTASIEKVRQLQREHLFLALEVGAPKEAFV